MEDMAIDANQYSNVTLFLGRLQGLPVHRQNLMFAYLTVSLLLIVYIFACLAVSYYKSYTHT